MSIPEQISGISLGSAYIRPGTEGVITSVTYIAGGWITVDTYSDLTSINHSRTSTGQLAYVSSSGQFYIAKKEAPDYVTTFDDTVSWNEFKFSGSFSGDGSQLTGIASALYLSGSTGSDTVNLKTDALTLTGSAQGIVVTVTDNKATFSIASPAVISGSFTGNGSGLTGVSAAPAGNDKTVQFRSGSVTAGAVDFVYDHTTGNVGIGTVSPSAKLVVNGDAIVTGKITAQEFHTEFVSASIIYESGSTQFGNSADDTHIFTGTVNITGSVLAPRFSGSFSGSFQGDGSNLTGIASTLALSGSTGNDLVNLKTDVLTITGSARNIDVAVTDNTATVSVSNNLALSNVALTGSFTGNFSGSVTAVITNAVTASYVLNAVSASYAVTSSFAVSATSAASATSASYATTASYVLNAVSASYALNATSASYAVTASYVLNAVSASFSLNAISASYAATASSADAFRVRNTLIASGLTYPVTDGTFSGQVLQTNAAGTLSFGNVAAVFEDIYNGEATTVVKGTALYVSGSQGATPKVYRADAADPARMPVTFVAMENIGTGAIGRGITLGLITGIDMPYAVGENLFINGNGTLTSTRPTGSSDIIQPVGIVTKPGNGGQLNVLNPGPVILPNLTSGSVWAGNPTNFPVAVLTSSLSVARAVSASYTTFAATATTASLALTASSVGQLNQNVVINGNLQVFGTSSFTYTTSSQLAVDSAFISVNVFEPVERFGGLKVYDSGSLSHLATASLAWDSQRDHWVYQNTTGSGYQGGGLLSGPRNTGSLGEETYPTLNTLVRGQGGDHLYDSNIKDNDVAVQVGIPLQVTGSAIITQNVVAQSFTGSFLGTLTGTATSASYALTASYVNPLNQNVIITGSLTVGSTSLGAAENTLTLGPSLAGGAGEGGQLGLSAVGGTYTSASFIDNWQNQFRILRGSNVGSDAQYFGLNLHSGQLLFSKYTGSGAFPGTVAATLAVDASGNVITTGLGGSGTVNAGVAGYIAYYPSNGTTVDDTSGLYWDSVNSRVGISTSSPAFKLDVTGDIRATGVIYANANGTMYFQGGDDAALYDINVANTLGVYGVQDSTIGSIKLGSGGGTISGKGNKIGIGTINPTSASLEVNGNVFATSYTGSILGNASTATSASFATYANSAGTATSASFATYANSAGTATSAATASFVAGYAQGTGTANEVTFWKSSNTVSGSSWLRVTSSIDGFNTPGLLLDGNYYSYASTATGGNGFVAQSGSLATTASIIGVNASQFEGQLYSSNGAEVKSAIRVSSLYTDGYTIGRLLTPGANNLLRIAPDVLILGTTTINGDLTVGGKVTAQEFHTEFVSASIIFSSGSTIFGNSSDDVHQFTGSVNVSAQVYAGLDNEILPNIVGYNTATGELTYYASSSVRATAIPGGSDNQVQYNDNGNLAGASGFVWDGTNVGVGTTSPIAPLTVLSTSTGYSSDSQIKISDGSTSYYGGLSFDDAGSTRLSVRNSYDGAGSVIGFGFGSSADKVQIIDGTGLIVKEGNVGIGTTSPEAKLDVSGSVKVLYPSGKLYAAATPSFYGEITPFNISGQMLLNVNYPGGVILFQSGSTTVGAFNSGNLGIGNDNPQYSLDVYDGKIGSSTSNLILTSTSYNTYIRAAAGHSVVINDTTSANIQMVNGGGNVGIGTTNPSYKLEVAGDILASAASGNRSVVLTTNNANAALNVLAGNGLELATDGSNKTLNFRTGVTTAMQILSTAALKLNSYGSGTFTGTATKTLAVDSSGNVIELDVSSNGTGAANQVAFWKDTDTVSGSASLTWNGSTFYINGTLEATEKSFVINHPTQEGKKLVYGVLEGPEHAVYCRGKISGEVIQLPEEWTGLVDQESITVQLTPIGKHQNLYVVDIKDNKVFIKNGDLLTSKINAYYYIQATRKDIKPLTTVREA